MVPDHIYACIRRDEVWRFKAGKAALSEMRDESGHAFTTTRSGALEIHASDDFATRFSDAFTAPRQVGRRLRHSFTNDEADAIRRSIGESDAEAEARIVTIARYVENEDRSHLSCSTTATIRREGASITTTAAAVDVDLRELVQSNDEVEGGIDYRDFPIVWSAGTASILLHEAIGHPAERDIFGETPKWMVVTDEPGEEVDDAGQETRARILTRRERPSALRRADFLSEPIRRMSNLIVSGTRASVDVPQRRLVISLVEEGAFDPVDDTVRLIVLRASLIDGDHFRRFGAFEFRERRTDVLSRCQGLNGTARRYRGTICSDDAQRLPVGGAAPDLLTAPFK